jgi:leucine-rich repeat protein SHOC2
VLKVARRGGESMSLAVMKLAELPLLDVFETQLTQLTDLNLSRNKLFNGDDLFEALLNLRHLKKLNVSDNCLNGPLSPHACELTRLEELRLDANRVTALPADSGAWVALRVLSASNNMLVTLPEQSIAWTELVCLNVKNNIIAEIPGDLIKFWEKLERLQCGGNKLRSLPEEIGFCTQLTELDCANNGIEEVPMGLTMCTQLNLLHLGNNKISLIAPEIFCMLTSLQELQLYKNKLTVLPPEIGNLVGEWQY